MKTWNLLLNIKVQEIYFCIAAIAAGYLQPLESSSIRCPAILSCVLAGWKIEQMSVYV